MLTDGVVIVTMAEIEAMIQQRVRDEALEEAALALEAEARDWPGSSLHCERCCTIIRALKGGGK